jgi:hypothetical protein
VSVELALGIIGTLTGLTSLLITMWKTMQEKPKIDIRDVFLHLEKQDRGKIVGKLSFNINFRSRVKTVTSVWSADNSDK